MPLGGCLSALLWLVCCGVALGWGCGAVMSVVVWLLQQGR